MGGKQKQSQRTKGNVKASSSARAAQVLESMGGFQGFGALGGDLGFVPVTQSSEDPDSSVDSDFRMLLRKLTKKDTTTKVKALQDISSLCKEKSVDEIKSVLPFWPRIYSKLSIDHERRVREATQLTHKELVHQVGRDMAPYLKTIVGPWLVARGDPYSPAAAAASAAFTEAFSATKQKDVLLFCKGDIMTHIEDNILKQTADTLSDKSVTEPEDMQSKYERTVASSLVGWRMFVLTVPPQSDLVPVYTNMLKQQQFWKLAIHHSELIRSSFYSLLSALCQVHPDLVTEEFAEKACTSTLYKLEETSRLVTPALWEATLHVVSTVKDWYQKINPKKGFFPKLFKVLSVAGEASCGVIFPNILPLLSKLPVEVISGKDTYFVDKYCESIQKSLLKEGELKNQKNIDTIVMSFVECVRFCLVTNLQQTDEDVVMFLSDKLGLILKASMRDESPCLSESPLYTEVGSLLLYLSKQLSEPRDNHQQHELLTNALTALWTTLKDTCVTPILETETQEASARVVFDRIGILMVAVHPQKINVRLKENESASSLSEIECTAYLSDESWLFKLVCDICKETYSKGVMDQSEVHLQLLCRILMSYKGSDLFKYLRKLNGDERVCSDRDTVCKLLEGLFLPMLKWIREEKTRQYMVSVLVDLVLSSGSQSQYPDMLERILKVIQTDVHYLCAFSQALIDSDNTALSAWLSGPLFGSIVVDFVRNLCSDVKTGIIERDTFKTDHRLTLVDLALSPTTTKGRHLGADPIDAAMTSVHDLLSSETEHRSQCVTLACLLAHKLFTAGNHHTANTKSLLLAFFKLDCAPSSTSDLSVRTGVSEIWQEAARLSLLEGEFISQSDSFFFSAASVLKDAMAAGSLEIQRLESLCSVGQSLLLCIPDVTSRLAVFRELLLPFTHPNHWNLRLVTAGILPIITDKPNYVSVQTDIHNCLSAVYFNGKLHTVVSDEVNKHTDSTEEVSSSDYPMHWCLGIALCRLHSVKLVKFDDVQSISVIATFLNGELCKLLGRDKEVVLAMTRRILNLALCEGGLWVEGLKTMLERTAEKVTYTDLEGILGPVERLCELASESHLHTHLVVMAVLSGNEIQDLVSCTVASIMSLPAEEAGVLSGYSGQLCLLTRAVELLCKDNITESATEVLKNVACLVTVLQAWKDKFDSLFLFESCLGEVDWPTITFCSQCIRFLTTVVQYADKWLAHDQWDFVMCAMLSWLQSCQESLPELLSPSDVGPQMFTVQTYALVKQICISMERVSGLSSEEKALYPAELHTEWTEFFSQGAFTIAIPMLIKLAESGHCIDPQVLTSVGDGASFCPLVHLLPQQLPPKLIATDQSALPDSLQTLVNYLTAMLLMHSQSLQVAAFKLLKKLIPEISRHEESRSSGDKEQEAETYQPPQGLWDTLDMCKDTLLAWFQELGIRIGDKWVPTEGSKEQSVTVAYFYSWLVLLELCKEASPTMTACYAGFLRDNGAIDSLMQMLFCTMPRQPISSTAEEITVIMSPTGKISCKTLFAEPMSLHVKGYWSERDVGHLACSVYLSVLEELPALVRQWYMTQDRRITELTDRFTSKFVSPYLCEKQLNEVRQEIVNSDNLKVKTRLVTREVIAVYSIDDASIELVVILPTNHPLGPVTVEQGKKIGIANNEWRNWMLQLTTFLQHQNGTLMKGLLLWKKNVDKKFEGVEECYICFSIIHGTTCQLPKLQCRTCKKKFHSSCLYKWFTTSNKATCPLCRNLF